MTEDELIDGCRREDVNCQRVLYELYSKKMLGVCMRYCNSKMEAEDVLQDSFVKIFDKIKHFEKSGSLEGWIRKIMVNTSLRSNDKRIYKHEPKSIDFISEPEVGAEILENMETKSLMKILQELPKGYKMVFNLYAVEGYTHHEISEMMSISESTSRTQYNRAKKYFIKLLQQYGITRE